MLTSVAARSVTPLLPKASRFDLLGEFSTLPGAEAAWQRNQWRLKLMSSEQLASRYCESLEEIKSRLALVHTLVAGTTSVGSERFNYELAALNLRKVLELVAFGSMTANKTAYAEAYDSFARDWNAKRLLGKLEGMHPDFYPKPIFVTRDEPGPPRHLNFDFVPDGFLTRDEFVQLYDLCSKVIHTPNPFADVKAIDFRRSVAQWAARIEALLRLHLMRLAGTAEVWVVQLSSADDNRAHAYVASPS